MLTKIDTNNVTSDEGFKVNISVPQMLITYTEDERVLEIEIEGTVDPYGMVVYSDSIAGWEPPHDSIPFSADDAARVLRNVKAALDFLGDTYVID